MLAVKHVCAMLIAIAALLCCLVTRAAATEKNTAALSHTGAELSVQAQSSVQRVTLTRGRCRGHCPVYRVEVYASGEVLLFEQPNAVVATSRARIAEADWQRILDAINETHFDRLQPRYVSKADGCRAVRTDASSLSITVTHSGRVQRLQFYSGCDVPERTKIMWLADTIATLSGARDWWRARQAQQLAPKQVE